MNLRTLAAHWSLGYLIGEELPLIALALLEDGIDSPTTRILAGEQRPTLSEAGPLFKRMLTELGQAIPSPLAAAHQLASTYAREIASGSLHPCDGATAIERLYHDFPDAGIPIIFTGLLSEYDDFMDPVRLEWYGEAHCERYLRELELRMVKAAEDLLASPGRVSSEQQSVISNQ